MNCLLTKYQLAALNPHNWLFEEYSKTDTKVFEDLKSVENFWESFLKDLKINEKALPETIQLFRR